MRLKDSLHLQSYSSLLNVHMQKILSLFFPKKQENVCAEKIGI